MLRLGSQPQELIFAKITVSSLRRSYDFYTEIIGLKPTDPARASDALASTEAFVEISLNQAGSPRDPALVLIRRAGDTPSPEAARMTWIGFKTPNVAEVIRKIRDAGGRIRDEATPYDGAEFGIAFDPDGYTIEFLRVDAA